MRRRGTETRRLIIEAADDLFYGEGVRGAGVDAIAKRAGVTKRTLYYHFASKDELVATYLEARDQPTLKRLKSAMRARDLASSVRALFKLVGNSGALPSWKGCAFIRVIHELAGQPDTQHACWRVGTRKVLSNGSRSRSSCRHQQG